MRHTRRSQRVHLKYLAIGFDLLAFTAVNVGTVLFDFKQLSCGACPFPYKRLNTLSSIIDYNFLSYMHFSVTRYGCEAYDDAPKWQCNMDCNSKNMYGDRNNYVEDISGFLQPYLYKRDLDKIIVLARKTEFLNSSRIKKHDSEGKIASRLLDLRGGGDLSTQSKKEKPRISKFLSPFQRLSNKVSTPSKLEEQQKILSSTRIMRVTAPCSELLPPELVKQYANEANLIGDTLTAETLDVTSNLINTWYTKNGYVLNTVTGALLVPDKNNEGQGSVELKVREVKLASSRRRFQQPVSILFVDQFSSNITEQDEFISIPVAQSNNLNRTQPLEQYQKHKIVSGRTRSSKIAKIVGMTSQSHFQIRPDRWSQLVAYTGGVFGDQIPNAKVRGGKSAIFSSIHAVRPIPNENNTVSVEIIASENRPYTSLEYGVTKSLYSDQWEGELDLKHANAFGGGEIATLNFRKGRMHEAESIQENEMDSRNFPGAHVMLRDWNKKLKDGPFSWKLSLQDDALGGGDAGYDLELYHENIDLHSQVSDGRTIEFFSPRRTGSTFRLRFPQLSLPQTVSTSFERIYHSQSGLVRNATRSESVASISINVGPYRFDGKTHDQLSPQRPSAIRSALTAAITAGTKWNDRNLNALTASKDNPGLLKNLNSGLYLTGTVTSQQIIPIRPSPFGFKGNSHPWIDFAMRQVMSSSTKHLPQYEAIMLALASRVRGYRNNYPSQYFHQKNHQDSSLKLEKQSTYLFQKDCQGTGAVSNSISGSMELRIPFKPFMKDQPNSNFEHLSSILTGALILFGDWAITQAHLEPSSSLGQRGSSTRWINNSSVGFGLRKVAQGIPLKLDFCITDTGTRGMFFGIGHDFNV